MSKEPEKSAEGQRERFIKASRWAGLDENKAAFERQLEAVAGGNSSAGAWKNEAGRFRKNPN